MASPPVHSALPITRRRRDQLSLVDHSKSLKHPRRLAPVRLRLRPRLAQGVGDARLQPRVARQAEHVVDRVGLAPGHQGLAGEAGVAAQHECCTRGQRARICWIMRAISSFAPALPSMFEGRAWRPEMSAAEHIKRQVAIAVVIAVKEPPLLIAVQRIVGRVEVEHDLTRRFGVRVEKQIDKQPSIAAPSWLIL